MNTRGQMRAFAIIAIGAMIGACGRGDRETAMAELETAFDTTRARAETAAGALGTREYSDAELIGLVRALDDTEIEVGRLGMSLATDPQVKSFATRIVREHRELKAETDSVAYQLELDPVLPEDDEDLVDDHRAAMRDLRTKAQGDEFDEAFLEHQIAMHRKLIDEVRDAAERSQDPTLRALLAKTRDGMAEHLSAAEGLEKRFGA